METCRLRPLGSRVIVKEVHLNNTTESGIVIPGKEKEHTNRGVVLRTGPGSQLEDGTIVPVHVKPGDMVLYSSFSGSPIKFEGDEETTYIALNERDIICVDEEYTH